MGANAVAVLMGCAALGIYVFTGIRIKKIRSEGRSRLMRDYSDDQERRDE